MAVETLERPQTISIRAADESRGSDEANWGPEDLHAIKAIAYIMNGIFSVALVMYGTITLFAWLGS
jgi:hypothetical protein